jgi:hypothetical protein
MRARIVGLGSIDWGLASSRGCAVICASCFGLGAVTSLAAALGVEEAWAGPQDRVAEISTSPAAAPDPPPRRGPPVVGPSQLGDVSVLDGLYVWLGPVGAATWVADGWDSTFGADLSIVRVREGARLGAIGATAGASLWTERDGGRIWVDALAGTRLGRRMYGATLGPIIELSERAHPRVGGAIGLWGFFGVTPFARVGAVQELGAFAEIGLHLALPVFRSRAPRRDR